MIKIGEYTWSHILDVRYVFYSIVIEILLSLFFHFKLSICVISINFIFQFFFTRQSCGRLSFLPIRNPHSVWLTHFSSCNTRCPILFQDSFRQTALRRLAPDTDSTHHVLPPAVRTKCFLLVTIKYR